MKNKNATTGKNAEKLFRDSISEYPDVIETLRSAHKIQGGFSGTMLTGTGGKCDVKMGFTCGRNIDVSIKAYTGDGFNQITRMTLDNFAQRFGLSDSERENLRELVLAKSQNPNRTPLFPSNKREDWKNIIEPLSGQIIRKSFSDHPSREILVLFNRDESIMRIWKMNRVIQGISKTVDYTRNGNIIIGGCVNLQRKGGNGKSAAAIDKTSADHPGNQVQIKLRIKKFIDLHHQKMLAEYQIFWG